MIKVGYIADFVFVCDICRQSKFDTSIGDLLINFKGWDEANQCKTCGKMYSKSRYVHLGKLTATTKTRIHKFPSVRTKDTELVITAKQFEKTVNTTGFSKDDLLHKFNAVIKQLLELHEAASIKMGRRKPKN